MAVKQVIADRYASPAHIATTYYSAPTRIGRLLAESAASVPWLATGFFINLKLRLDAALAAGGTCAITLRINGVDTSLTATLSDTVLSAAIAIPVTVSDGDLVSLKFVLNQANLILGRIIWYTLEFNGTVTGRSVYTSAGTLSNSVSGRQPPFTGTSGAWLGSAGTLIHNVAAAAGVIDGYRVDLDGAPGVGTSYAFAIYKNGTKQDGGGGTVDTRTTIADSATTASLAFSLTVSPGDTLYVQCDPTGSPTVRAGKLGVKFVGTTDGESQVCGWTLDTTANGATEFLFPQAQAVDLWTATETDVEYDGGISSFILRTMYVTLDGTPATTTFRVRQNHAAPSGGPVVALAAALTGSDLTGTVTIVNGDTFSVQYVQTSGGSRITHWGMVQYAIAGSNPSATPGCSGGGAITVVADPASGETFSGRRYEPRAWLTVAYDDQDRRFALDAYNHPSTYTGGRKNGYVLKLGAITRQLSDRFSSYKMADCIIAIDDTSRFMSLAEATAVSQYWANREGRIQIASATTIAAGGTPQTLFRGIWRGHGNKGLQRSLTFTDVLGSEFSDFNLEGLVPSRTFTRDDFPNCPDQSLNRPVPIAYGVISDKTLVTITAPSSLTLDTTIPIPTGLGCADYSGAAGDMSGQRFGLVTSVIGTRESLPSFLAGTLEYNRAIYFRWNRSSPTVDGYRLYFFNGVTGAWTPTHGHIAGGDETFVRVMTHDNVTFDATVFGDFQILVQHDTDGANALTGATVQKDIGKGKIKPVYVGTFVWPNGASYPSVGVNDQTLYHAFVIAGHAIRHVEGKYRNNLVMDATSALEIIDQDHTNWAGLTGSTDKYITLNGNRYAMVFIKAGTVIGDSAADGSAPLTLNICGIEDVGDTSGVTITAAPRVANHLIDQWILHQYTTGAWATPATSADGIPWLNSSSFNALEAIEIARVGGEGYLAAIYLDAAISARELLSRLLLSFDMRFGQNEHGQIIAKHLNEFLDLTTCVTVADLTEIIEDTTIDRRINELENKIVYDYAFRPADGSFESPDNVDRDSVAIANNRGRATVGEHRQMYFVNDPSTAVNVNHQALTLGKYPPRYVELVGPLSLNRIKLGDVIRVTDVDGVGATGWTLQPLWVLGIQTILGDLTTPITVHLKCLDVANFYATTGLSPSASVSPSATASSTPSGSPSQSPSASQSPSISTSPSASQSPTPSASASPSTSPSASKSPSASTSPSASVSPSSSSSLSKSPSASASPSASQSPSASVSPTPSASKSPSASISSTSSASTSPSASKSPSASVSASMSPSQSPSASKSPSASRSPSSSKSPSASASPSP